MNDRLNSAPRRRSNSIGVISTGLPGSVLAHNPYTSGILHGVLSTAEERGVNVTLFMHAWESREQSERWIRNTSVDGMLILAPDVHTDLIQTLAQSGIPLTATSAFQPSRRTTSKA